MSPGVIQYVRFGEMRQQIRWRRDIQRCPRSQMKEKFFPWWPNRLKTRDVALNTKKQEANINISRRGICRC